MSRGAAVRTVALWSLGLAEAINGTRRGAGRPLPHEATHLVVGIAAMSQPRRAGLLSANSARTWWVSMRAHSRYAALCDPPALNRRTRVTALGQARRQSLDVSCLITAARPVAGGPKTLTGPAGFSRA
jgi:hypothetical protein